MESVFISIFIIWVLLAFIALSNNYLYNANFNRKEREVWEFVIRNADKFDYVGNSTISKEFRWGDYLAIIWVDNTCSIHINTPTRNECLATHFDKVMSNKMRELLLIQRKNYEALHC